MQKQIDWKETVDPLETVRSDADEPALTRYDQMIGRAKRARLSPLARAALANGVSFDDVLAFESSARRCDSIIDLALACGLKFEAVADEALDSMRIELALDAALERSQALLASTRARDTLPASIPWWHTCSDVQT